MIRTEVTSMTVPDKLPARMRMDGRTIFQQIKNYFDTETKNILSIPIPIMASPCIWNPTS